MTQSHGQATADTGVPTAGVRGARMLSGALLFFVARCAGILFGLAVTLLLTRALTRSEFATLSLGLTLVVLGTSLSDGVNSVLVRESIHTPADEEALLVWGRRYRWVIGLGGVLAVTTLTFPLVTGTAQRLTVIALSLALPLFAPTVLYSVLQRRYLAGRVALLMLLQSGQWLAAVAVLAWLRAPLIAYGIAYPLTILLYSMEMTVVARRVRGHAGGDGLDARTAWNRLRQAVPLGALAILAIGYAKADGMILYGVKGAAASAGYIAAYRLLDVANVLPASLNSVFFPAFTHSMDEPGTTTVGARWIRYGILVSAPAALLGVILAEPLVHVALGGRYPDSVLLLRLLLASFVFVCLEWIFTSMAAATGMARRQLQVAIAGLVLNIVANFALIPLWGALACCLTTLGTELAVVVLSWYCLRRRLNGPVWPSAGFVLRLAAVLSVAALPAAVLPAVPAAALAAFLYVGGAVLLRLVTVDDYHLALARPPTGAPPSMSAAAEPS
jgi:O-antigen/teichoic acid export membrane protein